MIFVTAIKTFALWGLLAGIIILFDRLYNLELKESPVLRKLKDIHISILNLVIGFMFIFVPLVGPGLAVLVCCVLASIIGWITVLAHSNNKKYMAFLAGLCFAVVYGVTIC